MLTSIYIFAGFDAADADSKRSAVMLSLAIDTQAAVAKGDVMAAGKNLLGCGSDYKQGIYVLGGCDTSGNPTSTVEKLSSSIDTAAMVAKGALAVARFKCSSASSENAVYTFGGQGGGGATMDDVDALYFAIDTATAIAKADLPAGRKGSGVAAI